MTNIMNKPSKLTYLGLFILLTAFIIGSFILYPLVATILGENLLESQSGNLTFVGGAINYFPYLVGLYLIVYDLFVRKLQPETNTFHYQKFSQISVVLGVMMVLIGIASLFTYDQATGANIGAGMLIFGGGVFILFGFGLLMMRRLTGHIIKLPTVLFRKNH